MSAGLAPVGLAAQDLELAWQHAPPGATFCAETAAWDHLACGGYGAFRLRLQPAGTGAPWGCRSARAAAAASVAGVLSRPPEAIATEGWTPCDQGACFAASDALPSRTWVAVVDWNNQHGWSVGETIHRLSAGTADLALYPLDEPAVPAIAALQQQLGDQVTTAHVLEQICRVADDAARAPLPPAVLNMSFGTVADADQPPCAVADSLLCHLDSVLAVLTGAHGVFALASAGNHGRELYPASGSGVHAVASQALRPVMPEARAWSGAPRDPDVTFVMPGYALTFDDPATGKRWAAPAGSSYATAFASGWLAYVETTFPALAANLAFVLRQFPAAYLDPTTGEWVPRVGMVGDVSWAAPRFFVYPMWVSERTMTAGFVRLLDAALGLHPALCSRSGSVPRHHLALEPSAALRTVGVASVVELQAQGVLPSPDAEPCVPCVMHRGRRAARDVEEVLLDLSASAGSAAGTRLLDLVLEVGAETYRPLANDLAAFLLDVERGSAGVVALSGLPAVAAGTPISLRYLLQRDADGEVFWDSSPVVYHEHDHGLLFADDFEGAPALRWDGSP